MYRQWAAASPRIVMLLVHGLGAHSGRWESLSRFLLQEDIASYAVELRGFGETAGPKGHVGSLKVYLDDICGLGEVIRREHPQAKIFLLGESLGGLIAFLLAALRPGLFSGLICISPAFKNKMKGAMKIFVRAYAALLYDRRKQFPVPFDSRMCTRDPLFQKILDEDPKEYRRASSWFLFVTRLAQIRAGFLKNRIILPTLFLVAGEDLLVDSRASEEIFKGLRVKDKTFIAYPGMYHALSTDLGKEKVFADILKWVRERSR